MAAPTAWAKGRLYLADSNTTEATPINKAVDYQYTPGENNEDIEYAGATVGQALSLLGKPSIAVNFIRDSGQNLVIKAARHWRDNGTGVKWYLYLDLTNEASVYAYGYAALEGTQLSGAATAGQKGTFNLRPGPEDVWDDSAIVG